MLLLLLYLEIHTSCPPRASSSLFPPSSTLGLGATRPKTAARPEAHLPVVFLSCELSRFLCACARGRLFGGWCVFPDRPFPKTRLSYFWVGFDEISFSSAFLHTVSRRGGEVQLPAPATPGRIAILPALRPCVGLEDSSLVARLRSFVFGE